MLRTYVDRQHSGLSRRPNWRQLTKVPKITVYFWIIKILSTALGEALSDYMVHRFNPYLAVIAGFMVFAVALVWQFVQKRYIPAVYWLAVTMVAVFGTMAADVAHIEFGISYVVSTIVFAVALLVVFSLWYRNERTLSIHSVYTFRRELFYWAAVLAAFAMGTAAGDLTAYSANLGFFSSGLLFTIIFALPALAYWLFRLNVVVAFWFAYVMTRPMGASFADWMGKAHAVGGLGFGDGPVALALVIFIVIFVGYVSTTGADTPAHRQRT